MKSCDVIESRAPSLLFKVFFVSVGVLCRRQRTIRGIAMMLVGLLLVVGAVKAQSLINFPSQTAASTALEKSPPLQNASSVPAASVYQPRHPPLASDPGVLEAPELIARDLNESDAAYTARMAQLGQQLKADAAVAQQDLARVLQQVSRAGHGMGTNAVTVQPQPALQVHSPVPADRRLQQIYDDGKGRRIPVEQLRR